MKRQREGLFEPKSKPLISGAAFASRLLYWLALATGLLAVSLMIGVLGYRGFENLTWIDSLLNAAMLLGGMGPVNPPMTFDGKLFASAYAIYCGLLQMICGGLLLVPVFHRVLHHFHADEDAG